MALLYIQQGHTYIRTYVRILHLQICNYLLTSTYLHYLYIQLNVRHSNVQRLYSDTYTIHIQYIYECPLFIISARIISAIRNISYMGWRIAIGEREGRNIREREGYIADIRNGRGTTAAGRKKREKTRRRTGGGQQPPLARGEKGSMNATLFLRHGIGYAPPPPHVGGAILEGRDKTGQDLSVPPH